MTYYPFEVIKITRQYIEEDLRHIAETVGALLNRKPGDYEIPTADSNA